MTIRYPLTVLTLGALLMASGAAIGGGMPSDEAPEVILDELGYGGVNGLDEDTIAAIIESQSRQLLPQAFVPAAYIAAVSAAEALDTPLPNEPQLGRALISPEDERRRYHR